MVFVQFSEFVKEICAGEKDKSFSVKKRLIRTRKCGKLNTVQGYETNCQEDETMKKFINQVELVEDQMIAGMVKAYPQYVRKLDCGNVVVRT